MRRRFKKVTSLIATLLLVISSIPIQPPKEVGAESGYNTGQGQMITGGAGSGSWSNNKQGYRIYVVDNNGNRVSNRVDYIYEYPPGDKADLKKLPFIKERFPAKGGVGSDKVVQYTKPPRPLIEEQNNVYAAGGEKFSSWFWGGDGNLADKGYLE